MSHPPQNVSRPHTSHKPRDHSKGRGTLQGFYMAGLSSTFTIGDDTVPTDGYNYDASDSTANSHPRVTRAEHEAHRIAVQVEASQRRDKSLSFPKRQVGNAPLQIPHQTEAGGRRHDLVGAHQSRLADVDMSRSSIKAQPHIETSKSAVNNKATRETKRNISNTKNENGSKAKHNASQTTNGAAVLERKSRFKEIFDDESCMNPILDGPKSEAAQLQNQVLKRSVPLSLKENSSTHSTAATSLESLTKTFRGLHLPGQHARRHDEKDSDSDSSEWVCETSSAIEAGRMTMDDVVAQFRGQRRL